MAPHRGDEPLDVPAAWLAAERRRPGRCARHGAPASSWQDVALVTRPTTKGTPAQAGAVSIAARVAENAQNQRGVSLTGWPLCESCLAHRSRLRGTARALLFGGLAVALAAVVTFLALGEPQPLLGLPIVLGVAAVICSGFVFGRSGWNAVLSAEVTPDGQWVRFAQPHPAFATELAALGGPREGPR
ncbi:hypothetical protein [Actinoalloteichus caeruleus]|uniref:hypothetical protein n=1 Tax=Actinoalloteichus cyanogriseus TaxID=2893586 RepID=UPI0004AA759C|nr:hypothetical protein [Actinoalloteichus caeruleus]